MQRLEVSGAVRPIYGSLGVKRLNITRIIHYKSSLDSVVFRCSMQWFRTVSARSGIDSTANVLKHFRRFFLLQFVALFSNYNGNTVMIECIKIFYA